MAWNFFVSYDNSDWLFTIKHLAWHSGCQRHLVTLQSKDPQVDNIIILIDIEIPWMWLRIFGLNKEFCFDFFLGVTSSV